MRRWMAGMAILGLLPSSSFVGGGVFQARHNEMSLRTPVVTEVYAQDYRHGNLWDLRNARSQLGLAAPAPLLDLDHSVAARAVTARASRSRSLPACGPDWQDTLGPDERWIDQHESHLHPDARNSSGAYGLGQLMPSTYRDLGLVVSSDPCEQITAQRRYMAERYGSWVVARAFWERHSWW